MEDSVACIFEVELLCPSCPSDSAFYQCNSKTGRMTLEARRGKNGKGLK
jgi:hypothetical protein